ncbi:MAG TPA: hypothetical protein PLB25_12490 [Rhodoferax sp.]|nr:hypothetical protein [Rhodoferax sp.]
MIDECRAACSASPAAHPDVFLKRLLRLPGWDAEYAQRVLTYFFGPQGVTPQPDSIAA